MTWKLKNFCRISIMLCTRASPGFLTFAEESSAYKGVTAATESGGLGFDYKWNMGWMNDTLSYFSEEHGTKKRKTRKDNIFFGIYER